MKLVIEIDDGELSSAVTTQGKAAISALGRLRGVDIAREEILSIWAERMNTNTDRYSETEPGEAISVLAAEVERLQKELTTKPDWAGCDIHYWRNETATALERAETAEAEVERLKEIKEDYDLQCQCRDAYRAERDRYKELLKRISKCGFLTFGLLAREALKEARHDD